MVDTCFSFWQLCEPACSVQHVSASLQFSFHTPSHLSPDSFTLLAKRKKRKQKKIVVACVYSRDKHKTQRKNNNNEK